MSTGLVRADEKPIQLAPIAEIRGQLDDPQYRQLVKDVICKGATDLEFQHCMAVAWHLGLDPLARQIFFITVYDSKLRREVWVPIVAVAGLLAVAQRTGEYQGRTKPEWCGQDGAWRDVWLADGPPAAAQVGVHRAGNVEPTYGIVTYREYCRRTRDGRPMAQWGVMPAHMLFKCALSQALRHSFSIEMAGDYGVQGLDMPGEPGRFRVKSDKALAEPGEIPVAEIIEGVRESKDFAELDEMTSMLKGRDLSETERQTALDAWNEARQRITKALESAKAVVSRATKGNGKKKKNGKAKAKAEPTPEPEAAPAGEHDYGPPPWDEMQAAEASAAAEATDQSDFGFDAETKGET
jgi:phage recombination protein Bet